MAFYRCGGGGIPSSLKTDMNAVFNKKFGTAVDYPPKQWPDDVNLMGPLPEKTIVSSPIADFSDGADDVPSSSVKVTISPTLDGVSSVSETRTGVNIWNEQWEVGGLNTSTGADIAQTDRIRSVGYIRVQPSTKYYFYNGTDIASQSNINIVVCCYNQNKEYTGTYYYKNKTQPTFSNPADCYYIRFYCVVGYGTTYKHDISINFHATDTTYHAYNGTTYTASLGRTIYGGTADIVNGVGSEQGYKVVVDGTNIYFSKQGNYYNSYPRPLPTLGNPWKLLQSDEISFGYNSTYGFIFLTVARAEELGLYSAEEVNAYFAQNPTTIILNLSTPTDFTFTGQEVPTRLGYNAFWSDDGDTEVTYRADINLALGGQ